MSTTWVRQEESLCDSRPWWSRLEGEGHPSGGPTIALRTRYDEDFNPDTPRTLNLRHTVAWPGGVPRASSHWPDPFTSVGTMQPVINESIPLDPDDWVTQYGRVSSGFRCHPQGW